MDPSDTGSRAGDDSTRPRRLQRFVARRTRAFRRSRAVRCVFLLAAFAVAVALGTICVYGCRYSRLIDERLSGDIRLRATRIYAAPRHIMLGEKLSLEDLVRLLRNAGYSDSGDSAAVGSYRVLGAALEIEPGVDSYLGATPPVRVEIAGDRVAHIRPAGARGDVPMAEIEPQMITALFDSSREKRRPLRFSELPTQLVHAVLAAEDKRFLDHPGVDLVRIVGAAWTDVRRGEKAQGASTITMQVARSFFFTTRREWGRKLQETLMALILEHRFSKQEIFELYANQIYLGNRGTFVVRGFGEASQAYFGKDVRELSLGEAAFLAGIIRAPNRYSPPERHPERAKEARDRVLALMLDSGFVSAREADREKSLSLRFASESAGSDLSAYAVDMVKDDVLGRLPDRDPGRAGCRIYTTLDLQLQMAATEAVESGMARVDGKLAARYAAWRKNGKECPRAQVALVALDPRTGGILALVGGRQYAESQLNRTLARRQPGSAFKPFVYAAAFRTALDGTEPVVTSATAIMDEPTTFLAGEREYTPANYGHDYRGAVTARDALVYSLNVATVKVAESVGLERIVEFARGIGLDVGLQPTPALALGAYEMTPLELAKGYAVFAGGGMMTEPHLIRRIVSRDGALMEEEKPSGRPVLDARIAYLTTNILEDAIDRGTGNVVRAMGFDAPAAGKTGTSRDGWFAGYTSSLLCVVWVGFDDGMELGLTGAESAAPIWASFMKRAAGIPGYGDPKPFERPEGIELATIDPESGELAVFSCPEKRDEFFIAGSGPTASCRLHGGLLNRFRPLSWLARLFGHGRRSAPRLPPGEITR